MLCRGRLRRYCAAEACEHWCIIPADSLAWAVISGAESEELLTVTGTCSARSGSVGVLVARECDSVYITHGSLSLLTISNL